MAAPVPAAPDDTRGPVELPVPGYVPTRVLYGHGAAATLGRLAREHLRHRVVRRPLVLTGRRSAAKGWLDQAVESCAVFGNPVVVGDLPAMPSPGALQSVVDTARRERVDAVLAVGGGSVLDTAKVVALLATGTHTVAGVLTGGAPGERVLPLVLAPTTAGSGAEVTRTATVWQHDLGRKHAIDSAGLFADLAVVDPLTTLSAPRAVWASSGLDALAQAIESSWAIASDEETLRFSLPAVRAAAGGLAALAEDQDDRAARALLCTASLAAGLSIARTRTTIPHALSYPITTQLGVPHGHACALTLAAVLRFNAAVTGADCRDPRGPRHVRDTVSAVHAGLGARTPAEGARVLDGLLDRLGLPGLPGIGPLDRAAVVQDVLTYDRFANNPRAMTRAQLTTLLAVDDPAARPPRGDTR